MKADPSPAKSSKAVTVGGVSGPVGLVVAGPRTAVLGGGGSTPPGVDLDQIAANMSNEKGRKGAVLNFKPNYQNYKGTLRVQPIQL